MRLSNILFISFLIALSSATIQDHYCGKLNCYKILNLEESATPQEIKQQFRKMSRQYHPDIARAKGKEDTTQVFQQINNAYEILSNKKLRQSYDYLLKHPEQSNMYHYYNYYQSAYLPQTNPFAVLGIFFTLLSLIQYAARKTMYQRACNYVYNSERFKRAVNDQFKDPDNSMTKEEIINELKQDVTIEGGWSEPKIKEILIIKIVLIPYNILYFIYEEIRMYIRYTIQKKEYTESDKYKITQKLLKIKEKKWNMIENQEKEQLIEKKLWIKDNLIAYQEEQQKIMEEQRQKFLQSGRGKRYSRYMKKYK